MSETKISVIIPVYNVEEYLNTCITSVVGQTYSKFEIILIDDGSKDNSSAICKMWAEKDSRIRFVHQENKGLGRTRNRGIDIAGGDYVLFLDSDDWLVDDCIEKVVKYIDEKDTDILLYNTRYCKTEDEYIYSTQYCDFSEGVNLKDMVLLYGAVGAGGKVIRKSFWQENNLFFFPYCFEDSSLHPILTLLANSIAFIKDDLYCYRYNRNGSITTEISNYTDVVLAYNFSIKELKHRNLFESNFDMLEKYFVRRIMGYLNVLKPQLQKYKTLIDEYMDFLNTNFPQWKEKYDIKVTVFGSFASKWEADKLIGAQYMVQEHFAFSSIISQFLPYQIRLNGIKVLHNNAARKKFIEWDITSKLYYEFDDILNKTDYLIIDFIPSLFDILVVKDAGYVTQSDAFYEATVEDIGETKKIILGSDDYWKLLNDAIDCMANMLNCNTHCKCILIQNRLAKYYKNGNELYSYEKEEDIERKNNILSDIENIFVERVKNVCVIPVKSAIYTDELSRYGITPENLNAALYNDVGWKLVKLLVRNQ